MPFYEYQCNNCGHALEAMQKVSDPPLKKCPHCGKPQLQKLMSAPVFRLKGGGWYETDFKSDQDSKRNLADRPEDAPKEDKKEAVAEQGSDAADARPRSPPRSRRRRRLRLIPARRRGARRAGLGRTRRVCASRPSGPRDPRSSAAAQSPRAAGSARSAGRSRAARGGDSAGRVRPGLADAGSKP